MDPKLLMEVSQVIQQLPPEKLNQMQTLMHNMMAGHDVSREMADFEKSLPADFREKLARLQTLTGAGGMVSGANAPVIETSASSNAAGTANGSGHDDMDLHQARITILHAVAEHRMTPEQAEKMLFS